MTYYSRLIGVSLSYGNLNAFIRLTLVNNSLADITPLRFSPGIPKNLGKPAPEPMKNAE